MTELVSLSISTPAWAPAKGEEPLPAVAAQSTTRRLAGVAALFVTVGALVGAYSLVSSALTGGGGFVIEDGDALADGDYAVPEEEAAVPVEVAAPPARLRARPNGLPAITNRSFTISDDGTTFLKDGKPHRILSAGFHYFRCPAAEWEERLLSIKAGGGINTIQTYIAWNFHCPDAEGECDFTGDRDLVQFVTLAQKHGFDVLLRPGPYICAEWEFGGFPAWLVGQDPTIRLRSSDPKYLAYVKTWYTTVLPLVAPLMHANGGPILMVQVENEYGAFSLIPDLAYLHYLRDLTRSLVGPEVLLYSTDPKVSIDLSVTGGVFQAIDFLYWGGSPNNVSYWWAQQQAAMTVRNSANETSLKGPPMNDEFYPGWLSQWGDAWVYSHTPAYVSDMVKEMMITTSQHSSVNFYMYFGGTNFGFWNGGSVTTSYDYGAPLNESGHPTNKFYALRDDVFPNIAGLNTPAAHKAAALPDVPTPTHYGPVVFDTASIRALTDPRTLAAITTKTAANQALPVGMEAMGQSYGYISYECPIPGGSSSPGATLLESITMVVQDYGLVYIDDVFIGHLRTVDGLGNFTISVPAAVASSSPAKVRIVVENTGRLNNPLPLQQVWKGMRTALLFTYADKTTATGTSYTTSSLPMKYEQVSRLWSAPQPPPVAAGATSAGYFVKGSVAIDGAVTGATMIDTRAFGKGFVFVNGHNVGRYWPIAGPQNSLFVPRSYLRQGANEVIVFEQAQPFNGAAVATMRVPSMSFSSENYNVRKDSDEGEPRTRRG